MPSEQTNDSDALKNVALNRYQLSADGFKNKFLEAKQDKGKTVFQFVARLKRYLDREANESVAAIMDLFIRKQLINICSKELTLFLKERFPRTIAEATQLAEQYLEVHGGTLKSQRSNRGVQPLHQSTPKQQQPPSKHTYAKPSDKRRTVRI